MPKRLLTVLGVTFGLAAIVGNTIGAGILSAPGSIAKLLPTPTLFFAVWIAGALYAFGGANAVCELATMMPKSGGQYHFSREALGSYAGFVVGWNDWVSVSGSATAIALVFSQAVVALVRGLAGTERAIGAALIVAFTLVVWRGVRIAALAQNITTAVKALALMAVIAAALILAHTLPHEPAAPAIPPHGAALLSAFIVAMQSVIFAYDGWTGAIYFSEEVTDPGRSIPRATFGGLLAVAVIYLLINLACVLVLPFSELAGDPLAVGSVARKIFGHGDIIVNVVLIISLPSVVNAMLPMAARVLFSMSRDRLAPAWAERVNAGGTPTTALFASAVVALLFLFTGGVDAVMSALAFIFVATYTLSFVSLFVLRRREPNAERPWRARGHPWTTGFMVAGSVAFLVGSIWSDIAGGGRNALLAAAVVAASYPLYRVFMRASSTR